MLKEKYKDLDLEVIAFDANDVIVTSGCTGTDDDDEGVYLPG